MVERNIDFKKFKTGWNNFLNNQETIKFFSFFKRYGIILLILMPILLCYQLRMTSTELPITDRWAQDAVLSKLRSQITPSVLQNYPHLPQNKIEEEVTRQYNLIYQENQNKIEMDIEATSNYFRSRLQDDSGHTYLLAIDPYYWARLADNVADHGFYGDIKKEIDGDYYNWDTYMMAPNGRYIPRDSFHAYFEGYLYKIVKLFKEDVIPVHVYFYTPIILIILAIIPAFFIAKRLGGNCAGFFSAVIIAIHPVILTRTPGGFADTDAYNILFPLLILWLFLLSFDAKQLHKKVIYGLLAGFLIGLFSVTWGGWYYVLGYIVVTCACYILFEVIRNWKEKSYKVLLIHQNPEARNAIIEVAIIIVFSWLFLALFKSDWLAIISFLPGLIHFTKLHQIQTVWPNVFTTVAEQNEGSFAMAVSQLGGNLLFAIALIGILASLYLTKKKKGKIDVKYFVFLLLWLLSTCWASTRGIRFTLLAAPPFAIGFGLAIGFFILLFKKLLVAINLDGKISAPFIFMAGLIFLGLLPWSTAGLYGSARTTAIQEFPSMNDAWYASLKKIDNEAAENAVINSWWDFGHWFKYLGNRPVTFDGTSQNTPMAHWIGKVLFTKNEAEAVGILRMLDCGSNNVADYIIAKGYDTAHAVEITNFIANEDNDWQAVQTYLARLNFTEEDRVYIRQNGKCLNPPENYFITSEDMVGKAPVWGHFGSWLFDRAQMFRDIQENYSNDAKGGTDYLIARFNMTQDDALSTYHQLEHMLSKEANNWIAPWPGISSAYIPCQRPANHTINQSIICGENLLINLENMTVAYNGENKLGKWVISYNGSIYEKLNDPSNMVGVFYSYEKNHAVLADTLLVDSMFMRLHFDGGVTTPRFKLFSHETSVIGHNIYIWKIDW